MADQSIFENIQSVLSRIEEIKRTFGVGKSRVDGEFSSRLRDEIARRGETESAMPASVRGGAAPGGAAGAGNLEPGDAREGEEAKGNSGGVEQIIKAASERYRIPEPLIRAVIAQESGFRETAVSPKGAMGLMQLMPQTARNLGVADPFDAGENIFGGTMYLRELVDLYGGNLNHALAAYNAGPNRVDGEIPDIPETRNYVKSVLDLYEIFTQSQNEEGF